MDYFQIVAVIDWLDKSISDQQHLRSQLDMERKKIVALVRSESTFSDYAVRVLKHAAALKSSIEDSR